MQKGRRGFALQGGQVARRPCRRCRVSWKTSGGAEKSGQITPERQRGSEPGKGAVKARRASRCDWGVDLPFVRKCAGAAVRARAPGESVAQVAQSVVSCAGTKTVRGAVPSSSKHRDWQGLNAGACLYPHAGGEVQVQNQPLAWHSGACHGEEGGCYLGDSLSTVAVEEHDEQSGRGSSNFTRD